MSFIETERLLLRTWMPRDLTAAQALFGDPTVMRYVGTGAAWSSDETKVVIERTIDDYERDGIGLWPVVLKADGTVVGACGLQALPRREEIELSVTFAQRLWGGGYGYEAARAVLAWGFGERGLARIVAVCDRENARSIRLINRLGMRYERIVRVYRADLMLYAARSTG